ncbi:transposase [Actinoplanes lobatus]|uniref:transposase n=1 Tax=Actinoplanes lobatus TaxID=113568 RepID=UPI002E20B760
MRRRWPARRCCGQRAAVWCSPWTSRRGCVPTTRVVRSARSATPKAAGADVTTITCAQIRQFLDPPHRGRPVEAGDRDILIVLDAGYEAPGIAWLLRDLPVEVLGRMRSDRVLRRPTPPRVYQPLGGRPGTPTPGVSSRLSRSPTPASTAKHGPKRGTGCTHG